LCLSAAEVIVTNVGIGVRADVRAVVGSSGGDALARIGAALSSDTDLSLVLQRLTDVATELSGAAFGAFYSRVEESPTHSTYVLHALTGRPQELPALSSYLAVPVRSRSGELIGGLSLGHPDVGVFTPAAERLALAVASSAGVALENARLLEAEQQARRETERSAARLRMLQDITAQLSTTWRTSEVVDVICASVCSAVAARSAYVMVVDRDADRLVLLGARSPADEVLRRFPSFPLDAPLPGSDAVRRREPVLLRSNAERDRLYPGLRGLKTDDEACVVVPLLLEDRVVGVLSLGWSQPRALPPADLTQLTAIAAQCAQALDRARLYEAAVDARRAAESTAGRLSLQQELTAALSGAADSAEVTDVILRYAVTALGARAASVGRVDQRSSTLRLLATRGVAEQALAFGRSRLDAALPASEAVRTGQVVVVTDRSDRDARYPELRGGPAEAFACVPMTLAGGVVGVLVVTFGEQLSLTAADRRFLEAIAHQCAQALERARLYDATRYVASTLQGSLLPASRPTIPGLEVAVRYRPIGRSGGLVGGDFYDVFRIAPGRWGVVIGDVSGKGIPAASLTALARYTVRAAARREPSPAEVLAFLNEAVLDSGVEDRFATVIYLEVEPGPVSTRVRFSIGGHPLPVLRRSGGEVVSVGRPGMAIGLLPVADLEDQELELGPGEALTLYTDGVAEARAPHGAFATGIVEEVTRSAADTDDAEALADRIERATLDFQDGDPRDDVAILVLRMPGDEGTRWFSAQSTAVTLEREPQSPSVARGVVRDFLREHRLDGDPDLFDTAALLVSELVTNAVVHARTSVGLRVSAVGDRLRVEVADGSRARPVRQDFRPEATGGRGLLLLDRLATTWEVRRTPDGKTVWFELALPAGSADPAP
jgi:GAF domain-containing protein/anti-sigma regulatory factor (Ser/Thr protein kinase)